MLAKNLLAFLIVAMSCFRLLRFAESKVPQEEGRSFSLSLSLSLHTLVICPMLLSEKMWGERNEISISESWVVLTTNKSIQLLSVINWAEFFPFI